MAQRFDFPVISEGDDADKVGAGAFSLRVETVYEDQSDWDFRSNTWTFDRGAAVGLVYLELARPQGERVLLTATFEFDDRDTVILKGVVPYEEESDRIGGGRIAVVSGTGKFQGLGGHVVPLEVRNPKRWG
jgi:hypothetical protein